MDKEKIRKEFNDFLDSASDETIKEFLNFLKKRKVEKEESKEGREILASFKSSLN